MRVLLRVVDALISNAQHSIGISQCLFMVAYAAMIIKIAQAIYTISVLECEVIKVIDK